MERFKKWWLNYWYHYKFRTIMGALLIAIAAVAVHSVVTMPKYDYNVYLFLSKDTVLNIHTAIAETAAQYGEDLNGDGEVKVKVIDCSFSPTNTTDSVGKISMLTAELSLANGYIFITDEYRFDYIKNTMQVDLFCNYDYLDSYNGKAQKMNGTMFDKILQAKMKEKGITEGVFSMSDYYVSMRVQSEKDSGYVFDNDYKMFERIVNSGE